MYQNSIIVHIKLNTFHHFIHHSAYNSTLSPTIPTSQCNGPPYTHYCGATWDHYHYSMCGWILHWSGGDTDMWKWWTVEREHHSPMYIWGLYTYTNHAYLIKTCTNSESTYICRVHAILYFAMYVWEQLHTYRLSITGSGTLYCSNQAANYLIYIMWTCTIHEN